jgi:hypothetical protein
MSCNKCKEKRDLKKELFNSPELENKNVLIFTIIWTILGLYGLYSFIVNIL